MSTTPMLDHIAQHGYPALFPDTLGEYVITCQDGTQLSVIAGWGTYCTPRAGGPYTAVEVMLLSDSAETPSSWADHYYDYGIYGIFARVPVEWVREYIEAHGGEQA